MSSEFLDTSIDGTLDVTGLVNGRDMPADGTKLDGVEAGAQANVGDVFDAAANDAALAGKAATSHTHDDRYYTETQVDTALNAKQDNLISGDNIKTVNGEALVGAGDLQVAAGTKLLFDKGLFGGI